MSAETVNTQTGEPIRGHVEEAQEAERVLNQRREGTEVRIAYGKAKDGTWQVTEERPPAIREPVVLVRGIANKALAMHKARSRCEARVRDGAACTWGPARTLKQRRRYERGTS